jgi:hypothetical protein
LKETFASMKLLNSWRFIFLLHKCDENIR